MFRKSMNLIHSFEASTLRYPKKSENDVGNAATCFLHSHTTENFKKDS